MDPNNNPSKNRVSKLQNLSAKKVRNQIEVVAGKLDKNQGQTHLLARLKDNVKAGSDHSLGREEKNGELGIRSIFYDRDWNSKGAAPFQYRNIPYNSRTFKRRTEVKVRLGNLRNIDIPGESPK
ncbi:hypothetical protein SKDZ_02G3000 [Saccharomyces kudriavzevii ZP591]|uniref:YBR194W-like protein n=1 Tax=Saccharomyces cerevisiae x Saccharomyces kudriavzevii (strain VIN7) TaxID=1095631 RepID=H0GRH8_SACCK|nr:YBR194W-like protein [Saccharomyces cerevisiae x Saccharomyces kudriavzevii VIN7]CAI4055763.1 hypothetical protein SKDZ_02G3000 [Saccharomyces kudriavzevii ZP591]